MPITITKELIVTEDIYFGFGQTTQSRGVGHLINAESIPYTVSENVKQALDSKVSLTTLSTEYAKINGDPSVRFSIADGVLLTHAASIGQLDTKASQTEVDLKADKSNVLELDNDDAYIPVYDYNPATKSYVDTSTYNLQQATIGKIGVNGAAAVPAGPTAQQPASPSVGYFRLDTDTNLPVMYINGAWYKFTITPV